MTLYHWIKIRDGLGIHSPDNSIEMHMRNISEQKHWCKAAGPLPYVLGGLFVLALYREFHVGKEGLPDVQAGFRKGRGTRDQIANIC